MSAATLRLPLVALGFSLLAQAGMAFEGAPLRDRVDALFEVGWQRSLRARAEAEQIYRDARQAAPGDHRVAYAYALVQLQQLRYADAAKLLDEVLEADKQNVTAWKTRAWLSAILKQYDAALAHAEQLAALAPPDAPPGAAGSPHRELADFLGRLCGYFEGPAKESVDQNRLAESRKRVLAGLSRDGQAVFDEARRGVLAQFAKSAAEVADSAEKAKADAEEKKEKKIGDLEKRQDEKAEEVAAAEARQAEAREKLVYEINRIQDELRHLADAARAIQVQALVARQDLDAVDARVAELVAAANREEDKDRKQRLLNEAARWRIRRSAPLATLAALDSRAAAVSSQQAALVRQGREAEARYQREFGRVQDLRAALDKVRAARTRVEGQPATASDPKVRTQKQRSTALTTYVPLPISLEQERKKVLEGLR